jgi:hypothetical protein
MIERWEITKCPVQERGPRVENSGWEWVVCFTHRPFYPWRNTSWHPLEIRLCVPQRSHEHNEEEKNYCPCRESNHDSSIIYPETYTDCVLSSPITLRWSYRNKERGCGLDWMGTNDELFWILYWTFWTHKCGQLNGKFSDYWLLKEDSAPCTESRGTTSSSSISSSSVGYSTVLPTARLRSVEW